MSRPPSSDEKKATHCAKCGSSFGIFSKKVRTFIYIQKDKRNRTLNKTKQIINSKAVELVEKYFVIVVLPIVSNFQVSLNFMEMNLCECVTAVSTKKNTLL